MCRSTAPTDPAGRAGQIDRIGRLFAANLHRFDRKLSDDRWSLREMLCHLIDSASNNHQRIVRLRLEPELLFPGYQAEAWVGVGRDAAAAMDGSSLVDFWLLYNRYLLALMAACPASALGRVWRGGGEPATLGFLIDDYFAHLAVHEALLVRRIAEIEADTAPAAPAGDACRIADADAAETAWIAESMARFDRDYLPAENVREINLVARGARGEALGGALASTRYNTVCIHTVWVNADQRRRGVGRSLILAVEARAKEWGCVISSLGTFESFGAKPFYEKLGYRVVSTSRDSPPGQFGYWFNKSI